MKIYPPFPTCREATPTRRAEKLIYEALEASELDGLALYEVKPLSSAPQLDFAVWILDVGTFGIQTKGGRYIMIDGEWHLVTDRGRIRKESPIPGTWDAAMAIHDLVQEQLRHKTFVIPVLVLTDMEPDAEIEALAAARNVAVHWGSPDNLVEHLVELAAERKVYVRPTSAGIAAEAELVLPGSTRAVRTTEPLAAPAHQVHIHVEHLHIHVAGPGGPGRICTRLLTGPPENVPAPDQPLSSARLHPKDSKVRTASRLASSSNSNTSLLTINVSKFGHLPSRSGRRRLISQAIP